MDELEEFLGIFFQECEERLGELQECLAAIMDGEWDSETLNAAFRAVHSVKGGAGAFGLNDLVEFTHVFETVMDKLRSDQLEPTPDLCNLLLRSSDMMERLIEAAQEGAAAPDDVVQPLKAELTVIAEGGEVASAIEAPAEAAPAQAEEAPAPSEAPEPAEEAAAEPEAEAVDEEAPAEQSETAAAGGANVFEISIAPGEDFIRSGHDPLRVIRALQNMGEVKSVEAEGEFAPFAEHDAVVCPLTFKVQLASDEARASIDDFLFIYTLTAEIEVKELNEAAAQTEEPPEEAAQPAEIEGVELFGAADPAPAAPVDDGVLFDTPAEAEPAPEAQAEPDAEAPVEPAAEAPTEPEGEAQSAADADAPEPAEEKAAEPEAQAEQKSGEKPAEEAAPEPKEAKADGEQEAKPAKAKNPPAAKVNKALRVELSRIDRLVNMVGEIVITQAVLAQNISEMEATQNLQIAHAVEAMSRQTRELQESVMAIRAQPVKSVFSRMPRVVRDLCALLDKECRIILSGEHTEVDTTVIEELAEPLTHMLRNSMDHGVEMPDDREAKGKPRCGTINLSAEHRGERVRIIIEDDGAGINRERVLGKAIENGIVSPEQTLSDEEIDMLIFHPGFSTAEAITNVSGRGVGMDVVKKKVQSLGGRVSVTSTPGKGTQFVITLPLTLAVLEGMTVGVGTERFILPLGSVVEAVKIDDKVVDHLPGEVQVLKYRGEWLPLICLRTVLSLETEEGGQDLVVVVETETDGRVALLVDELLGQRQVVLKSLEANFRRVDGVSGATILGDGRVALILDIPALHTMCGGGSFGGSREFSL